MGEREPKRTPEPATRAGAAAPGPERRLPRWKKALFSAFWLVIFFATVELLLWASGVRPILHDEDPHVGFTGYIPLFVEETRPDGVRVMVTGRNKIRFFNPQEFLAEKEANAYRIFCVGESTTYGHPYDDRTSFCRWLRELLPAADPSRKWEAINAGGISYASYRLALVMEELSRYRPDLFVIYVGHNEFLERRTYRGIIDTPAAVRGLESLVSRTRTFTVLKRLVYGRTGASSIARQEPTAGSRASLPAEVEAVLDRSVGPADYTRDDALGEQVLAHYRFNLARMIDIARSVGARVILVTPASNLKDCEPFKSEHRAGLGKTGERQWERLFADAARARAEGRLADALRLLDTAAAIDERHAHLHHLRGQVLHAMGRYAEAKAALMRARDEDICPLRALTPVQQIILDVAAERGAPCVDFIALVEGRSPQGIPGEDSFLDHVHPTIEGHRLLALALLDEMIRLSAVHPVASWGEATVQQVTRRVEGGFDRQTQGLALKNLAKTLGWAGKFEEARKLGERAAAMLPGDVEIRFNLGDAFEKRGDLESARAQYEIAVKLDPRYAEAWNKLGRVLEKQGNLPQAVTHYEQALRCKPDFADAHGNLGNVLANQDNLAQAVPHLEEASRLEPQNTETLHKLGVTYLRQGNLAQAEARLRDAIRVRPDLARAHSNLGLVLVDQGKTAEALAEYEEALRLEPGYAHARDSLGNLFASQGKIAEAVACFAAVLRLEPENRGTSDKLRRMAERMEAAVRGRPGNAEAHHALGLVLAAQGKRADAAASQEAALRLQPDHAQAHFHLALLRAEERARGAEAALHFRAALGREPGLAAAARGLAWLLATHPDAAVRDGPEALRWARQAAETAAGDDTGTLEVLAAAHAEVGRLGDAAALQQKALDLIRGSRDREREDAIEARLRVYLAGHPYRTE